MCQTIGKHPCCPTETIWTCGNPTCRLSSNATIISCSYSCHSCFLASLESRPPSPTSPSRLPRMFMLDDASQGMLERIRGDPASPASSGTTTGAAVFDSSNYKGKDVERPKPLALEPARQYGRLAENGLQENIGYAGQGEEDRRLCEYYNDGSSVGNGYTHGGSSATGYFDGNSREGSLSASFGPPTPSIPTAPANYHHPSYYYPPNCDPGMYAHHHYAPPLPTMEEIYRRSEDIAQYPTRILPDPRYSFTRILSPYPSSVNIHHVSRDAAEKPYEYPQTPDFYRQQRHEWSMSLYAQGEDQQQQQQQQEEEEEEEEEDYESQPDNTSGDGGYEPNVTSDEQHVRYDLSDYDILPASRPATATGNFKSPQPPHQGLLGAMPDSEFAQPSPLVLPLTAIDVDDVVGVKVDVVGTDIGGGGRRTSKRTRRQVSYTYPEDDEGGPSNAKKRKTVAKKKTTTRKKKGVEIQVDEGATVDEDDGGVGDDSMISVDVPADEVTPQSADGGSSLEMNEDGKQKELGYPAEAVEEIRSIAMENGMKSQRSVQTVSDE